MRTGETLIGNAELAGSAEGGQTSESNTKLTVWKIAVIVVLSLLLLFSFLRVGKFYWTKRRLRLLESHKPPPSTTVDDLERGLQVPSARRGVVTREEDVEGDGSPAYSKEIGEGEKVLAVGAHVKAAVDPPAPLIEERRNGTG